MLKKNLYIFLLLYMPPFIDSLSGYLILTGNLSSDGTANTPSQFFRIIIITMSFLIIKKHKKIFTYNFILLSYLIFIEIIAWFFHQTTYGLIIGVTWTSKLALLSLSFSSLYVLFLHNKLGPNQLLFHIRNNILISSTLLLVTTGLSLNFATYIEGTFGSKGLFASGNGLSVYLGTGALLSIYYWKKNPNTISYFLSLFILSSVLFIGTKSALIFSLLGFTVQIFLANKSFLSVATVLSAIFILFLKQDELLNTFTIMFDVINYRFENNDSLSSYIFSGRDVKFENALSIYNLENWNATRFITGFGSFVSFNEITSSNIRFSTMESDFFDIFFMYGLIGIVIYFYIYLRLVISSKKDYVLLIILTMWFMHSLFAGHSLFNGMSGQLLPLIAVLILIKTPLNRTTIS